jgi:hypothetical protein
MTDLSKFKTKQELFKFLKDNQEDLIAEKKFEMKRGDVVSFIYKNSVDKDGANKASGDGVDNTMQVRCVINTTNIRDSHGDVHIDGLWKKTLQENKRIYLLEQHKQDFNGIISRDVKASTKKMSWRDLGIDADGETEALIFDAVLKRETNPAMFDVYKRGEVDNHSVGMRYVKIKMCVNSDEDYMKEEKANWDEYIDRVVNKEEAEDRGYFYAITEAKIIEGSAVLFGSNPVTPTLETKNRQPDTSTVNTITEPPQGTQKSESLFEKIGKTVKN